MKNTHEGVLLSVKLQAKSCNFTKSHSPPWMFFTFLNCKMVRNRTKYHIFVGVLDYIPHSPPDCHKLFTSQWNIEQIGFMLLPSKYFTPFCRVFVVGFEHVFIYYEHFVELNQAGFCKKRPDLVILLSQQRGISFRFIVFLHFYCVSRLPQSIFFGILRIGLETRVSDGKIGF